MMPRRVERGLGVVVGLDLLHDAGTVGADDIQTQRQLRGDVGKRFAGGDVDEHLVLARRLVVVLVHGQDHRFHYRVARCPEFGDKWVCL